MFLEPFSRQSVVHRLVVTVSPRPFSGVAEHDRVAVPNSQLLEIPDLCARQFPLLPEEGSQSPDQPAVQLREELLAESDPEVVQPTGNHSV